MSIKTVYLDMDGVLTDFRKGCETHDAIDGTKVDWKKIHKLGTGFWTELEWLDGAEAFYKWLLKYCKSRKCDLCILSSVNYEAGVTGKHEWLDAHCPEIVRQNRYFVKNGHQKSKYASEDAMLIDDYGKNIEAFVMANGKGVKYGNPAQAKSDIVSIV